MPKRKQTMAHSKRLGMRVTPETKALLQRAAAIRGRTLSDFVLASAQSAQEEAERTIQENDVMALSVNDSRRFADLVLNPPEPNEHLRAALHLYQSDVVSDA